ncbi:MAG: triose-phosphate isomerase [Immundisolibacter sp.]
MSRKLVVGNWKMHGSRAQVDALLQALKAGLARAQGVDVAVCPPFPYLMQAAGLLAGTDVGVGAQNLAVEAAGAYTGEVSGEMLADVGCRYVIVGHSERRTLYGEDSALVARKYRAAVAQGLVPILCVGEQLAEREAGMTEQVVAAQLDAVLDLCGEAALATAVIAYEPVWAIGTGKVAAPEQAQAVHAFIRGRVARGADTPTLLYGGSVKPDNAAGLFVQPDVDGGLIGGASLVAEQFLAICEAARN